MRQARTRVVATYRTLTSSLRHYSLGRDSHFYKAKSKVPLEGYLQGSGSWFLDLDVDAAYSLSLCFVFCMLALQNCLLRSEQVASARFVCFVTFH